MASQNQRILDYVKAHGSITQLIAAHLKPAILRLSERIRELESDGHTFIHSMENNDSHGKHARYIYQSYSAKPEKVKMTVQFSAVCPECRKSYYGTKEGDFRICNMCKQKSPA